MKGNQGSQPASAARHKEWELSSHPAPVKLQADCSLMPNPNKSCATELCRNLDPRMIKITFNGLEILNSLGNLS